MAITTGTTKPKRMEDTDWTTKIGKGEYYLFSDSVAHLFYRDLDGQLWTVHDCTTPPDGYVEICL